MTFNNDSWACWASWPDTEVGKLFKMNELSNNHLLTGSDSVKKVLLEAEPGDHIRLKGLLAEYSSKSNGFKRGTNSSRKDRGNGTCETIYLDEFMIAAKANCKTRRLYQLPKWLSLISTI